MNDPIAQLFALGLGPWLTPLHGKIPALGAWQALPPTDEPTVRDWLAAGYNLGLRTGARSGLVVIDDDQARNGTSGYVAPPTDLVADTPTGGRHFYYRCPAPAPRNSASRLAPYVDVRGEGGQCVVPPSVHPIALTSYRWRSTGEPGTFPTPTTRVDMTTPTPSGTGYAQSALLREAHAVRTAGEGSRHDTLIRASFSLGQLVAGGALTADVVTTELASAASLCGLPESEAIRTIRDGLSGGAAHPRTAPVTSTVTVVGSVAPSASPDVLVPGSHVLPGGEYVEQGNHAFAHDVLSRLDPETLYRRAGILGEITSGMFVAVAVNRLRSVIDATVRLTAGKPPKGEDDEPTIVFRPCSRDHAAVVLDYGQAQGGVRELQHLASYPICLAPDYRMAAPGWNPDGGVYLDCTDIPEPLPLPEARAVLEDLVADFPFQTTADRSNFFGLLLTPILRPALNEPVPMHLIGSPMERTGKSKLAEIVLGISITGKTIDATQIGDSEDEREKRILSWLLRGQSIVHMDNLTEFLGSAALASLLTSRSYQGRILGSSAAPSVTNGLTLVGTGNNVHATGEIAKRIVPIRLLPSTETPETRSDFRHPDLVAYVTSARPRVLGALLGLVEAWREAGCPLHRAAFGGFERWTAVVGGIMATAGYTDWLTTMDEWRSGADDTGQENRSLVTAWFERHGTEWVAASKVFDLAVELELYGWIDSAKTEPARRRVFAVRVLNRLAGRVVSVKNGSEVRIMTDGVGARRKVRLDEIG